MQAFKFFLIMVNFSSGNMIQDLKNNKVKRIKTNQQIKFSFYLLQYVVNQF